MFRRMTTIASALALAAGLAACSAATTTPDGAAPLRYRDQIFDAVTTTSDITFGTAQDQTGATQSLKLDMYQPTGDTATARPVYVLVHGGGFMRGDKTSPGLVDEATIFAKKGYVTVSINYRLLAGGCKEGGPNRGTTACVTERLNARQDAQSAVRFLRANATKYRIDTNRIAIGGDSAGAVTALSVGYNAENPGPGAHQDQSPAVQAVAALSGAAVSPDDKAIGSGDAPALLFNAEDDPLVPYEWAQRTVTAATDAGLKAELVSWPTGGHVPYDEYHDQIVANTANFFYWMMDLAHAAR